MDVSVASYYIERKDNKGSQMGHTKKIFKKIIIIKKIIGQQIVLLTQSKTQSLSKWWMNEKNFCIALGMGPLKM